MSRKNIFEVLQSIAEDSEFNERFLAILREYGYEGTLEEAEETLKQQTQVVLNNLTTEDLQNVAGGRFLMNGKLQKALAVGGASLMAGGVVLPHGSALTEQSALTKKSILTETSEIAKKTATNFVKAAYDSADGNLVHTTINFGLGLATMLIMADKFLGGKSGSNLPFSNKPLAFLHEKDLSNGQLVYNFIDNLSKGENSVKIEKKHNQETKVVLSINDIAGIQKNEINENVESNENEQKYTSIQLLFTLIKMMDNKDCYVDSEDRLTATGAEILNHLAAYIIGEVNEAIKRTYKVETAKQKLETQNEVRKKADQKREDAEVAELEYSIQLSKYKNFVNKVLAKIDEIVTALKNLKQEGKTEKIEKLINKYKVGEETNKDALIDFTTIRDNCDLESDPAVDDEKLKPLTGDLHKALTDISESEKPEDIQKCVEEIITKVKKKFENLTAYSDAKKKQLITAKNEYLHADTEYKRLKKELKIAQEANQKKSGLLEIPRRKFEERDKIYPIQEHNM